MKPSESRSGALSFSKLNGHVVATVRNAAADLSVSLYGGHVMSWKPRGHDDVLWLSPAVTIEAGKSIRGGVPVCWPWFGPHPADAGAPMHGFARITTWELESASAPAPDCTKLTLRLSKSAVARQFNPPSFELKLRISVGRELTISLESGNRGNADLVFSGCLHSYFRTGDIAQTLVHGLEGAAYFDKTDGLEKTHGREPLAFPAKVDRIYHAVGAAHVEDRRLGRTLRIENEGAADLVVWNPGPGVETQFPGFAAGDERHFVCVEPAQTKAVTLKRGERRTLSTRITLG